MKNEEKNFRKFRKGPIFLAVLFFLAACAGFSYIFQKINEDKIVAQEVLGKWQAEDARRTEIKALEIFLENMKGERAALDLHFARSSNVVPFLDSLEELGRLAGAKPEVMSVATTADGTSLEVTVKALGSFESVYKFLELLENSDYQLEFLAMDLSRVSEESGSAGWEGFFRIKLLTFIP